VFAFILSARETGTGARAGRRCALGGGLLVFGVFSLLLFFCFFFWGGGGSYLSRMPNVSESSINARERVGRNANSLRVLEFDLVVGVYGWGLY